MSDKLFKGQTTAAMLAQFFYYKTPQFVFFIIPLTVLIGAMVTDRHPDEEQRAGRDAGLRHQPVPRRRAAGAAGGGRQRRDVPAAGSRAALLEPARAGAAARHPRRHAAHLRRRQPQVAGRARRQHLQLHVLRPAAARAERPVDLRVRPDARRPRRGASTSATRASMPGIGPGLEVDQRLGARVHERHRPEGVRDVPVARPDARGARLLRDRIAGRRPHDLRAAASATSATWRPAASTSCRRPSRCTARCRSRS